MKVFETDSLILRRSHSQNKMQCETALMISTNEVVEVNRYANKNVFFIDTC